MVLGEKLMHFDGLNRSNLSELLSAKAFVTLYSLARSPMLRLLARERPNAETVQYQTDFGRLCFRNDLGNAAGYDKEGELLWLNYAMGAGFSIVGTTFNESNEGNHLSPYLKFNPWTPLPASHGAVNYLGLPSKGVENVICHIEKFREECRPVGFPIGGSIMAHPRQKGKAQLEGTVECLNKLISHVDFLEINESCPNVHHDAGNDVLGGRLERLVSARDAYQGQSGRKVPIFVKLANFGDVPETVRFFTSLGVDGLVGVNTQKNYEFLKQSIFRADREIFDYFTKTYGGGVSGEPIREFAHWSVKEAALEIQKQKSPLKLIYVGGIRTHEHFLKSRELGDAVVLREWYTGMMEVMSCRPFDQVYKSVLTGR